MKTLRTHIKEKIFEIREERDKEKTSFWCTESEVNQLEIYFRFKGIKPTNPMTPETQFGLNIRTKVEDVILKYIEDILVKPLPYKDNDGNMIEEPDQHRVEMERLGIPITGYMDAIIVEVTEEEDKKIIEIIPVEVKTSYGPYAMAELKRCEPKIGYLKQLAQYVDYVNSNLEKYIPTIKKMFPEGNTELKISNKGYLFQLHFSNNGFIPEDFYQFALIKNGNKCKCGNIEFDLEEDIYKRYKKIWNEYIVPDVEPKSEYIYKFPLDDIDWKSLPKSKIQNARGNKAVIGDWQVLYSSWKDMIVKKEGNELGYNDDEIIRINNLTKGYTTWNKTSGWK